MTKNLVVPLGDRRTHVPALDGMRGLAILLVLIYHMVGYCQCHGRWSSIMRNICFGGWIGVDLFFVLSGFLITGILWESRNAEHYFKNFFARRMLRIFPLYYASLIALLVLLPLAGPLTVHLPTPIRQPSMDLLKGLGVADHYWPLFYAHFVDVLVAWQGFKIWMTHFWSLSIEEHFYLLWPFLVHRLSRRMLIIISCFLIVAAFIMRAVATRLIDPNAVYTLTPFRMDGLALGGLIALLWREPEYRQKLNYGAWVVLPGTGILLLVVFIKKGFESHLSHLSQTFGFLASILFFGSLLIITLHSKRIGSVFCHRFFCLFGKYSYSIYIFQIFPMFFGSALFALGNPSRFSVVLYTLKYFSGGHVFSMNRSLMVLDCILYVLFVTVTSIGIAMITWRVIEAPCLRLKRFFSYETKDHAVEGSALVMHLTQN